MDEQSRLEQPDVVVGVDGSGAALRAVRWAATEARRCRVPLPIVHAAPDTLGGPPGEKRAAGVLAVVRGSPCSVMVVRADAHVLDPEGQDAPTRAVPAVAPASWALRPHDRAELW